MVLCLQCYRPPFWRERVHFGWVRALHPAGMWCRVCMLRVSVEEKPGRRQGGLVQMAAQVDPEFLTSCLSQNTDAKCRLLHS